MNNLYFERYEEKDFKNMEKFSEVFNCKILPTPKLHHYDASAITEDNKILLIELKDRNQDYQIEKNTISGFSKGGKVYYTNEIIIEEHKFSSLLKTNMEIPSSVPLYVNFLNNGYAVVFNLNHLSYQPKKVEINNIYSSGYERREKGLRYLLNINDAWIYKLNEDDNYVLFKKPNPRFKQEKEEAVV